MADQDAGARPDDNLDALEMATGDGDIEGGAGLSTRLEGEPDSGLSSAMGPEGGAEGRSITGAIGNVGSDATTRGPDDVVDIEGRTAIGQGSRPDAGSVTGHVAAENDDEQT